MEIRAQEFIDKDTIPMKGMLFSSYLKLPKERRKEYITGRFEEYTGYVSGENALFDDELRIESTLYRLLITAGPLNKKGYNFYRAVPFRVMDLNEGNRPNIILPKDFKFMLESVIMNNNRPFFTGEYKTAMVLRKDYEWLEAINKIKKNGESGIGQILLDIVSR
jgi:hypothetical protein